MQISLKWINELVNLDTVNLDDLITKLTLGGFEVEEVLEVEIDNKKNIALDISATANRSDSLAIQGLSIEIAALLNQTSILSDYAMTRTRWSKEFENLKSIPLTQDSCLGFISLTIENLIDFTSPKWLQQKLIASGITPENNLLDFQNYIQLEMGYPIEMYDLDKIYSEVNESQIELTLASAKNGQSFVANNDNTYSLDDSILILKANNLPISIGGIISSKESHYSTATKSLLVEASIFNAAKIRQQSRNLGLRTNRSSRYEKALKNINLLDALYRFVSLLRLANPDLICKLHTLTQPKIELSHRIELNYETIKQVLGPIKNSTSNTSEYISPQVVSESLKRLQFNIEYNSKTLKWNVDIPPLRSDDIVQEIDLIEEIGRIYGFNNFLTRLPAIKNIGVEDLDYQTRKKVTSCLVNIGLNELIQYSLVNQQTYLKNEIELINPLVKDYSHLRISLLPNLLRSVEENSKKGNSILEGFEYGRVFSTSSSSFVKEIEYVSGIFGGVQTKSNWSDSYTSPSWFEAKGRLEQFFKKLNITTYWKTYQPIQEKNILHLYSSAEIFLSNGSKLGVFGKISPVLAKRLSLSADIYLFELNFELIKTQIYQNKLTIYQEYSLYPKIIKDLSFIINKDIPFDKIRDLLYLNGTHFLKEVNLLDEYQGKSIPHDQTSICIQLVFQSKFETLQTKKVEIILENLIKLLQKKFDIIVRI